MLVVTPMLPEELYNSLVEQMEETLMKTHYLNRRISIYRIPFRLGFLLIVKPAIEIVFWMGIYQITIILQRANWSTAIAKMIKRYLMIDSGAFIELGGFHKNGSKSIEMLDAEER